MLWVLIIIVLLLLIVAAFKFESPGSGMLLSIILICIILWKLGLSNYVIDFVGGFSSPTEIEEV